MVFALPATTSTIRMGSVYRAYTNTAPATGTPIRLNATLGVTYGGKTAGAFTPLSATFGGKSSTYQYV